MNCTLHVGTALVAHREAPPQFVQLEYSYYERVVLRCPVAGCHVVALGTGEVDARICKNCGARIDHDQLTEHWCYKCKHERAAQRWHRNHAQASTTRRSRA